MELGRVLYVPYQLVRRPLAAVDRRAVSKLAPENPIRGAYRGALGVADTMMAMLLDEPGLAGADTLEPERRVDDLADVADVEDVEEHESSPTEEQRRKAFAKKEDQVTRANHSPAAMQRDLARMHAVVEAREHSDAE